jgi:hypothetical protein
MAMYRVAFVEPMPGYRLKVRFSDGTEGTIALEDRLFGPMFEPLRDLPLFEQVSVDPFGVIHWPNGADLAPDAIYERLRSAVAR